MMFDDILIALGAGLFIHFGTKIINFYFNFYHIFKYLDSYQKLNYFKNNTVILILNKFSKIKNIIINFILIPVIKINYLIISIFTSILYSLCEDEFKIFLKEKGIPYNNMPCESNPNQSPQAENKEFSFNKELKIDKNLNQEIEIQSDKLLINHDFIHKINSQYDKQINDIIQLEKNLIDSDKNNSNNILSSPSSGDSFNYNPSPESKPTTKLGSNQNLDLTNEFELINNKKKQINEKNVPNQQNEEILDNYIINESSIKKKQELEKNILEFKNNNKNQSMKNFIIEEQNVKKSDEKEQIETIQMDEIDFGTGVSNLIEKYVKEGKIKPVTIEPVKQNETKTNEIKIGKKKK